MTTPSPDNLLLGAGQIYIDLYENGLRTGEFAFGNATAFGINTSVETAQKRQSMTKTRDLYKEVPTGSTIELNIVGDEFTEDNVALASLGVRTEIVQAAGSKAGEIATASSKKGRFYPLDFRNVSNVEVTVGVSPKVEGVDYAVDSVSGRIQVLASGSIVDGSTLSVDYDYAALTAQAIEGGVATSREAFVRFVADPAAGPAYEVQIFKVNLTPNGELGFISDDFGNFTLKGTVLKVPGQPPYKLIKLS